MALQQDRARWANMLVERGVVSSLAAIDKDGQPSARPGPPRPTLLVRVLVRTHSRIVDPRIVGLVSQIENCAETPVESKRRAAVATHVRCRTTAIRDKRALERVHGAAQVFSSLPLLACHTLCWYPGWNRLAEISKCLSAHAEPAALPEARFRPGPASQCESAY